MPSGKGFRLGNPTDCNSFWFQTLWASTSSALKHLAVDLLKKSNKLKQLYLFFSKLTMLNPLWTYFTVLNLHPNCSEREWRNCVLRTGTTPTTPISFYKSTERYRLFCMTCFCPKTNQILRALAAVVVLTCEWCVQFPPTLLLEKLVL